MNSLNRSIICLFFLFAVYAAPAKNARAQDAKTNDVSAPEQDSLASDRPLVEIIADDENSRTANPRISSGTPGVRDEGLAKNTESQNTENRDTEKRDVENGDTENGSSATDLPKKPLLAPPTADAKLAKLTGILDGTMPPPANWPTSRVNIRRPRGIVVTDSNGNRGTRMVYESLQVDPKKKDLTPKERHSLLVVVLEKQITDTRDKMLQTDDGAEKSQHLETLRQNYADRFRVDTAFQNLKVKEIEQRAKKLRNEVTERAASEEDWVNAMTTLAEMRSNGIDPLVPPISSGLPQPSVGVTSWDTSTDASRFDTRDGSDSPAYQNLRTARSTFSNALQSKPSLTDPRFSLPQGRTEVQRPSQPDFANRRDAAVSRQRVGFGEPVQPSNDNDLRMRMNDREQRPASDFAAPPMRRPLAPTK